MAFPRVSFTTVRSENVFRIQWNACILNYFHFPLTKQQGLVKSSTIELISQTPENRKIQIGFLCCPCFAKIALPHNVTPGTWTMFFPLFFKWINLAVRRHFFEQFDNDVVGPITRQNSKLITDSLVEHACICVAFLQFVYFRVSSSLFGDAMQRHIFRRPPTPLSPRRWETKTGLFKERAPAVIGFNGWRG